MRFSGIFLFIDSKKYSFKSFEKLVQFQQIEFFKEELSWKIVDRRLEQSQEISSIKIF